MTLNLELEGHLQLLSGGAHYEKSYTRTVRLNPPRLEWPSNLKVTLNNPQRVSDEPARAIKASNNHRRSGGSGTVPASPLFPSPEQVSGGAFGRPRERREWPAKAEQHRSRPSPAPFESREGRG